MTHFPTLFRPVSRLLLLLLLLAAIFMGGGRSAFAAPALPPVTVLLPSKRPSGFAANDQIRVTFYPAQNANSTRAPAIVLLHPIGESEGGILARFMDKLAAQMAAQGMGCALIILPYHGPRTVGKTDPASHFIGPRVADVVQAFGQSASDVSTVADWLQSRPDTDPQKLGVMGISLGAVIAHLAMGQDARLNAGVALEGGGDLPSLYAGSAEVALYGHYLPELLTQEARARLSLVDPAHYARFNQPRHVLMIEAARDLYVPPRNAEYLWNALGHPHIVWTDTNHFSFLLAGRSLSRTSGAYLQRVWAGRADDPAPLPHYFVPTIKVGWLLELNGNLTPMIALQAYSFATGRLHLSALHLDIGETGRGPYVGLATSLTPYIEAGMEHRFFGTSVQPYVSLHIAF